MKQSRPSARRWGIVALAAAWVFVFAGPVFAQDDEDDAAEAADDDGAAKSPPEVQDAKSKINNLPQNLKGMSGLVYTTSTRPLDPGTVEVGTAWTQTDSPDPEFTRTTYALNAGVGIPGNFEFGLHIPYVESNLNIGERENEFGATERTFDQENHDGMGSVEGMLKWGFVQPSLFLPIFAVGIGGIAPGDGYDHMVSDVKAWGMRGMLAVGVEINDLFFTDYAFAIMADGQVVIRDLGVSGRDYEEKSGEVHLGMVFPLHPRNYVTLITEYEGILMRGTTNEEDQNGVLAGLRFTTQHINVTAGAEYIAMEVEDMDDQTRFFAQLSYKLGPPKPLFP